MRINSKGFLMAETIVTVCIIATLATSMFLYISSNANRFEERNNYENVVDVYKLNTIKQYLEETNNINTTSTNAISSLGTLGTNLKVKQAFLILNTTTNINTIKNNSTSQSFKDYLSWLVIDGNAVDKRLIIMFQDGSNTPTFANILIPTE